MKPFSLRKYLLFILTLLPMFPLPIFASDPAEPSTGDAMLLVMLISVGTTALMFLVITVYAKIAARKKK